jgi:hypothetical protein
MAVWDVASDPPPELKDSVLFAALVCGALLLSHFLMGGYIAYKDLTGKWDQYSLKVSCVLLLFAQSGYVRPDWCSCTSFALPCPAVPAE